MLIFRVKTPLILILSILRRTSNDQIALLRKMKLNNCIPVDFVPRMLRILRTAGQKVVYSALLMFYAFRRKGTPVWARNIILGALGYLLTPIDTIPDLTPILGFTDDFGVLSFGLVTIASYINDDVRMKARRTMGRFFGKPDIEAMQSVDASL